MGAVNERGIGAALEVARTNWLYERARFEEAKAAAYERIVEGYMAGVSEVTLAKLFGLDRGTIRKIVGKTRK